MQDERTGLITPRLFAPVQISANRDNPICCRARRSENTDSSGSQFRVTPGGHPGGVIHDAISFSHKNSLFHKCILCPDTPQSPLTLCPQILSVRVLTPKRLQLFSHNSDFHMVPASPLPPILAGGPARPLPCPCPTTPAPHRPRLQPPPPA